MEKICYLALLRGINVGGKNIIKMIELTQAFEELHFSEVKTYIQSGNVVFKTAETDISKLIKKIQKTLLKKFDAAINVALLTCADMDEVIHNKPKKFGEDTNHKYDVIYLMPPLQGKEAIKEIKTRDGVDTIHSGKRVFYISRLVSQLSKSYFAKLLETSIYKDITIRNWNTTKKLYELMIAKP
jgi:uncharacterized protein (DUF1697 family)